MNENNQDFIKFVEEFIDKCLHGLPSAEERMKMYTEAYRFIDSGSNKWREIDEILHSVCQTKFQEVPITDGIESKIAIISHAFAYLERIRNEAYSPLQKSLQTLYDTVTK